MNVFFNFLSCEKDKPLPKIEQEKKFLKIQEIAKIAFLSIFGAFCFLGTLGIIFTAVPCLMPVGLELLTISLIALGVLGIISLSEVITPYLPDFLASLVNHIRSFVKEIFSLLALIAVAPIDLTKKDPKTMEEIDPEETPILLIHGFLGSSNNWVYQKARLSKEHKNIFTINLGSPLCSIDEYAQKVDSKVREIRALTGRNDIRLICHSMGGLVARQWRYKYAKNMDVKDIITVGSPLKGTYAAYLSLGISACGKEMFPQSSLLKEQEEWASKETKTNYYHIGSHTDLIILPNGSAYDTTTPKSKVKVDILDATGHVNYLFSDTVGDLINTYLKNL